jgi:hypothetical protein
MATRAPRPSPVQLPAGVLAFVEALARADATRDYARARREQQEGN